MKNKKKLVAAAVAGVLLLVLIASMVCKDTGEYKDYAAFYQWVEDGNVASASIDKDNVQFTLIGSDKKYYTVNPGYEQFKEFLLLHKVAVTTDRTEDMFYTVIDLLMDAVFFAIFGGMFYMVFFRTKKQFPIVRNSSASFEDIAGMEKEKKDMRQLVELMKNSKEYEERGIRQPKGILLAGPPGNGKTLFARALAGEAGVNFIATKATDFQSMYMSIGPAKVKALFKRARKHAPCIVFIDEFDGIGEKRNYAGQGIDKENNRMITALLNELDGFEQNKSGVVVIAATNNVKDLDPALVRAGRFDRKYVINNPDLETRKQLITMYLKHKTLDSALNLNQMAEQFEKLACAQIEAIMNETCLVSEERKSEMVTKEDLAVAIARVAN